MLDISTALPPIASVAGNFIDAYTSAQANASNAANVDKQIAFQKQQGETQYQRAVEDMKKAGLNPALAYQQGGNQAMQGAAATVQPITQNTGTKLATALDTYNSFATAAAQRDLLHSQASATDADRILKLKQGAVLEADATLGQNPDYISEYGKTRFSKLLAERFTAEKTPERYKADIANIGAGTAQSQAAAAEARARTTIDEGMFQNKYFREHLAPYINSTAKTLGIFRNVQNLTYGQP
jgi:hypothetical protein